MSNINNVAKLDPRPEMINKLSKATLVTGARFIQKTDFDPLSGCLVWTGAKTMGTHGIFTMSAKPVSAHRAAFSLFCGPVLPTVVMKTCRTPFCVHPGHLAADPRRGAKVDTLWTN